MKNQASDEIPILPDDLMLLIFAELTTEERSPLGTTCMRFRELDFELGRKCFDSIHVRMVPSAVFVTGKGPLTKYSYLRKDSETDHVSYLQTRMLRKALGKKTLNSIDIELMSKMIENAPMAENEQKKISNRVQKTHHNARVFRKAKTNALRICQDVDDLPDLTFVENLCSPIPFKKLCIALNDDHACVKLCHVLVKNAKFKKSQIFLDSRGKSENSNSPQDIERIRALIMQFPKIDALNLELAPLSKKSIGNSCIINDATFLHLVSNTNHVALSETHCSAQGIIDAFEVFCRSTKYKYVAFDARNVTLSDLQAAAHVLFEAVPTRQNPLELCVKDLASNCKMWVDTTPGRTRKDEMARINAAGKMIRNRMVWD